MRRIFIKGLNLITSTSARFKKLLSPLILLNFRRNFTKCVINRNPAIFPKISLHTIFGEATGFITVLINIGCDFGVPSIVSNM